MFLMLILTSYLVKWINQVHVFLIYAIRFLVFKIKLQILVVVVVVAIIKQVHIFLTINFREISINLIENKIKNAS